MLREDRSLSLRYSFDGTAWRDKIIVARHGPDSGALFISKDAGANFGAQMSAMAEGTASDQWAGVSFYPTFGNFPSDTGPRRCADIVCGFDGTWGSQFMLLCVGDAAANDDGRLTGKVLRLTHDRVTPGRDNEISLGSAVARWAEIYCATGVITTSDAREKFDVETLDARANAFVMALEPKAFRWKKAGAMDVKTGEVDADGWTAIRREALVGRRLHAGFTAQQVKDALEAIGLDLALWGLDDPQDETSRQWLRYDQFIAPIVACLQAAHARIDALEARLAVGDGDPVR